MIDILIVEDESRAAVLLENSLSRLWDKESYRILNVIDTVRDCVDFLQTQNSPDLILMDIQLADGLCFDIFNQVEINCGVIFTTAYSDYAIDAFKVNGIHYLLKPIEDEQLKTALDRYSSSEISARIDFNSLNQLIGSFNSAKYKERFLAYERDAMVSVKTSDIELFQLDNGLLKLHTISGRKLRIHATMENILGQLDPDKFFRASRQEIISKEHINKIEVYFNQRLLVTMKNFRENQIVISKNRSIEFKNWIDQ